MYSLKKNNFSDKNKIFILAFIICSLLLYGAFKLYNNEKLISINETYEDLKLIGDNKENQINEWILERKADANVFSKLPQILQLFDNNQQNDKIKRDIYDYLQYANKMYNYNNIKIVNADGDILISVDSNEHRNSDYLANFIKINKYLIEPKISDFNYCPTHNKIHIYIVSPILISNKIRGFVVIRVNPDDYLYPLINKWPTKNFSAETVIAKLDSGHALVLNQLLYDKNTALNSKANLKYINYPIVQAVLGKIGIFEGLDYKDKRVISYIKPIRGTNWKMVNKIDAEEIFQEMNKKLIFIFIFTFILILISILGLALIYKSSKNNYNERLYLREKELRESQEDFKFVFDLSPAGKSITSLNGEMKANEAFYKMLGYDAKDAPNINWTDISHPDDLQKINENLDFILHGYKNTVIYEQRYFKKDGSIIWCEINQVLKTDQNNHPLYFVSTIKETTQQRKAEKDRVESEERLKAFLANTAIIAWMKDENGKHIFASENFQKIFNLDYKKYYGKSDFELWPKEIAENYINNDKLVLDSGNSNEFVEKSKDKDGNIVWWLVHKFLYEDKENRKYVGGLGINITENRRTQDKLKENEEKLRTIFDTLAEGVAFNEIVYNQAGEMIDYRIIEVNKAYYEIADFNSNEIIGKLATEIYGITSEAINEFWNFHKNQTITQFSEFVSPISKKYFFISTSPFINNRFITSFFEITKLKKAEEELIIAKERAEESDKLKTTFLQNMSHEIRTPLNGIIGFAQLLKFPNVESKEIKEYADLIILSGKRLNNLISNILDISKIEASKTVVNKTKVNINGFLNDIYEFYNLMLNEKNLELKLTKSFDDNECYSLIDKNLLYQIFQNLLDNALKFTPTGIIEFGYELNQDKIRYFVKDSGIGMSIENKSKIFDRFFQIDSSISRGYEGAGLGLSIVKGLIHILNGKIWVESEENKGTEFYFEFPFEKIDILNPESIIGDNIKKNYIENPTVLVAEDDMPSFSIIEFLLKKENINIIHAINGEEALQLFTSNKKIDLILLDIKMPVMSGLEVAFKIKAINPKIPIIAQSANAFDSNIKEALSAGCNDYITKPIDINQFNKLLSKYLTLKV